MRALQDRGRGDTAGPSGPLEVAGVIVSNANRVVYPGAGVPKGDLARYWETMAEGALVQFGVVELGLESWLRATGGKGLHLVVHLVRRSGWDEVKDAREGKVNVDYPRNGRNATATGTFSPRARHGAPVALPLTWAEAEALKAPLRMSVTQVAEIDWAARNPWAGFDDLRQSIAKAIRDALRVQQHGFHGCGHRGEAVHAPRLVVSEAACFDLEGYPCKQKRQCSLPSPIHQSWSTSAALIGCLPPGQPSTRRVERRKEHAARGVALRHGASRICTSACRSERSRSSSV